MRELKSKNTIIQIAECWEELSFDQKLFTFEVLAEVISGKYNANPHRALVELFIEFTGYKPSKKYASDYDRESINLFLLQQAEKIDFIFKINTESNIIIPKYEFRTNPFPYIAIGNEKYEGKHFELDITAKTDITAREFVDCIDLLAGIDKMKSEKEKEECVNQLCAILYPRTSDYIQNMVSGHNKSMQKLNPVVKFGIVYWFTGIYRFYTEHEIYSLLFNSSKKQDDDEDKVRLSDEVILLLEKEGYESPDNMNINKYFDAQVKHLKDVIGKALSEGLTAFQIAQKTKIDIITINKLS